MTTTAPRPAPSVLDGPGARPLLDGQRTTGEQLLVKVFVAVPLLALLAAVPLAWGWGLSWTDIGLAMFFYLLSGFGVTVGFHRHFTHRAFKATRALRIGLAIAGSMAFQGSIITWVADHRRHHAFTDKEGDPHSPWLFGTTPVAVARGFWHAHFGWMIKTRAHQPGPVRPRPARRPRHRPDRRAVPALDGAEPRGARHPGRPAQLVVVGRGDGVLLGRAGPGRRPAHVTWSVNSICHMIGDRPWTHRDRSTNFWPLATLSFGESWHNLHHADPTCARHGVGRGQIDVSARVIAILERLGWADDIRWPAPERLARLAASRDRRG